jgi:hypothetical protein
LRERGVHLSVDQSLNCDELPIEEKEIVCLPESLQGSPDQIAAVECEQMIIREDSIAFMAIPKHASFYVQTAETSPSEMETEPPERDVPEVIIPPPAPIPAVVTQLLMFGRLLESTPRRKAPRRPSSTATTSDQLGLFRD